MFRLWMALGIVGLIGIDQLTKYWAVSALADGPIPLIPGVFELQLTYNTGAAWNMLDGQTLLLIILPFLVTGVVAVVLFAGKFRTSRWVNIGGTLLVAGGIGNLIDRLLAGRVTDFLYFKLIDFPIFNFADCCVVIGAAMILIFVMFFYEDTKKKKGEMGDATDVELPARAGGDED